ncbi:MAG: CCA tRNA nucleotidyltransferase [Gemmatimonadaceae bacterium]
MTETLITPPPEVLEIADRLERAGFETWCVGGAVRDALLGHQHLDWDLSTAATPEQVRSVFGHHRTIPVGIEFGTVGVLDAQGTLHEVTTFRRDVKTDGRHAVVEFGASIDEDLARRDFTINAIAYHPRRHELRDPFEGRADLERGIVRAVGDPDARMREDRLRALRAIRFAGRLGFQIEPATWRAIRSSAPHFTRLSAERVKQELEKTLEQVRAPSRSLQLWLDSGAMGVLVPALAHASPTTLATLDCLAVPALAPDRGRRDGRRLARLAALFAQLPGEQAGKTLADLRFSKHDAAAVARLVDAWARVGTEMALALEAGAPSAPQVRRWVASIRRLEVPATMRLAAASWAARRNAGEAVPGPSQVRALYRRLRDSARRDPVELGDLALDGDDLRRAGIPPGPTLGKILHVLLEAVIAEPARNTPGWLLEEATRLHHDATPGNPPAAPTR